MQQYRGRETRTNSEFGVKWLDTDERRTDARSAVAHTQSADAVAIREQDLIELLQPRLRLALIEL